MTNTLYNTNYQALSTIPVMDFYNNINKTHNKMLYRKITVDITYDKSGSRIKTPKGELNNLELSKIQTNIGYPGGNTLSLYVKYIKDLYVVDFDQKNIESCELFNMLTNNKTATTITTKGYHFYVYIKNLPWYYDQQKIGNEGIEVDLIKTNNIWETIDRTVRGDIKTFDWNEIKRYFDTDKMNMFDFNDDRWETGVSVSKPKAKPKPKPVKEAEPLKEPEPTQSLKEENDDDDFIMEDLPICDEETFKKHLDSIKPRYEYSDWLKIGAICYNNFNGDERGLYYWNEYSKKDEEGYEGKKQLREKYNTFKTNRNCKVSFKTLIHWRNIDFPVKNPYEKWYADGTLMENMNKECAYYTVTSEIFYTSGTTFIRNTDQKARVFYASYGFTPEGEKKRINPFDIWLNDIDRKKVDMIVFNPRGDCFKNQFNIWKGFLINKTGPSDEIIISKWLNHIKSIWANDNEATYNYILNWFAQFLQKPWKKNNVCLVLHSVEGVGKSMILNMIGKIMGDSYYHSTSSLKQILGDFNGDAEGKILINLNETNWGGDKKMVGSFKEFITDNTVSINRKNKEPYTVHNYANTIITTNEEWIVSIKADDRRFNLLECKNEKYDEAYYNEIANTDIQAIANFLYNRDISGYDSRVFEKSELHKEQVELNFNSVELFWKTFNEGEYDIKREDCTEWSSKPDFYELYRSNVTGTHSTTYNNVHFWKQLKKIEPNLVVRCSNGRNIPVPQFKIAPVT